MLYLVPDLYWEDTRKNKVNAGRK